MKIVVIGGTGLIGSKLVNKLREMGEEVLAASPDSGVNTLTGEGLTEALAGAEVGVDVSNSPSFEDDYRLEEIVRLRDGRGGEEALGLAAAGIPFEVVPGVSSGFAVPGSAAIPVTHRGLSANVTFATAQLASGEPDWPHLARAGTLVLFMAGQRLEHSTRALISAGRDPATPAAVVEAGTWEHERVVEGVLSGISARAKKSGLGSPALLVVGEVVSLRTTLAAFHRRAEGPAPGAVRRSTR